MPAHSDSSDPCLGEFGHADPERELEDVLEDGEDKRDRSDGVIEGISSIFTGTDEVIKRKSQVGGQMIRDTDQKIDKTRQVARPIEESTTDKRIDGDTDWRLNETSTREYNVQECYMISIFGPITSIEELSLETVKVIAVVDHRVENTNGGRNEAELEMVLVVGDKPLRSNGEEQEMMMVTGLMNSSKVIGAQNQGHGKP
ncbi:hypothetical protein H4Q26_004368 [Puccinia striiformis f. sp. tritici PST-130]|nr:hypothetical protein H4Q26_004368 [Puccinia striiformis f. sp. tritici PST-130]